MDLGVDSKVTKGSKIEAGFGYGPIKAGFEDSEETETGWQALKQKSDEAEHAMMTDVSQLASTDHTMERTTTCTPMIYDDAGIIMTGSDAPLGAGLWQWVISTED